MISLHLSMLLFCASKNALRTAMVLRMQGAPLVPWKPTQDLICATPSVFEQYSNDLQKPHPFNTTTQNDLLYPFPDFQIWYCFRGFYCVHAGIILIQLSI